MTPQIAGYTERRPDEDNSLHTEPQSHRGELRFLAQSASDYAKPRELGLPSEETMDGIDRDRLADALRVLAEVEQLPTEHPDAVAVRRATGRLFKTVKEQRRAERRAAILANDQAVTAATATGAPGRIDDETQGLELTSSATGDRAGTLVRARACYVCKQRYREVDAFYHQLCPPCAAHHHERREARTDLTGRRAVLTGGRAKIGMYIALRLLRDGAHTTITTRFPHDAVRRFTAMDDSAEWLHRLRVVGIDLRDPAQVLALADDVAAQGPLDILINNAAQTVRRSPEAYAHLAAAEQAPLPSGPLPEVISLGRHARRAREHARRCRATTGRPRLTHSPRSR